jgi:LacI family transcriptional regulator
MVTARVSMADVAARAGVSVSTVSLVLNDVPGKRILPDTRDRVRHAAGELGYVVNGLARSLRLQHSPVIGFISDEVLTTPFAVGMVLGALETASRLGWTVMMTNTGVDRAAEAAEIRALVERQVATFLYVRMYHHQGVVIPASLAGYPTVLVDGSCSDPQIASVVPDDAGGGAAAARELIDHGHTRIAFINNADDIPAARERLAGFESELRRAGLAMESQYLVTGRSDATAGLDGGRRLLDLPEPPSAIFCFNDRVAMGVYQAAHERRLEIPEDLSIIGFDNQTGVADSLVPGLTTVALPHYEMGAWAVQTLISQIQDPDLTPTQARLPCLLVRRGSVAVEAGSPSWSDSGSTAEEDRR